MSNIHERIRQIRDLHGYSQDYVSERLGISVNAYSKIERGETSLTWDRIGQIAGVFGIDPVKIITFDTSSFFAQNATNCNVGSNNVIYPSVHDAEVNSYLTEITQLKHENELAILQMENLKRELALKDELIELLKKHPN